MPQVIYLNQTDFRQSMIALRRRGGAYQIAFKKAGDIITSLGLGIDCSQYITNNGEKRIAHAVKYDLGHGCRLVTVQTDHFIYLLHVGPHDETELWIEKNRGLRMAVNPETKELRIIHVTEKNDTSARPFPTSPIYTEENLPFLKRIPGFQIEDWVQDSYIRSQLLRVDENSDDSSIEELLAHIASTNNDLASFLFDLICEVKAGNLDGAQGRVEQERGLAVPVDQDPEAEAAAIANETNSQRLANLSGMSREDVERLLSAEKFRDWMLFLHPDQKKIAEADFDKPTVLTGVSGSGKTVVLVHRARYLARKYPGERIGVVTLSRSLARLISGQLDELCKPAQRQQIHVMAFYDIFKQVVDHFGPAEFLQQLREAAKGHDDETYILRAIEQVDPRTFAREVASGSNETLSDTWELFIDQPAVQTQLAYFAEHLQNYQSGIDAERYLQEELSLIRSAFPTSSRSSDYLEFERHGRAIPLTKNIRKRVLAALLLWEETMLTGGMLDVLSLTSAALPHVMKIKELPPEKRFRCLLIDEFQDFSTLDLSLLRRLPTQLGENGLFLTGDTVQRVLVKDLRMGAVGLDIISANRVRLLRNYRNSKQILEAAFLLAKEYATKASALVEDIEILDPELTIRETAPPILERVPDGGEIQRAWEIVADCLKNEQSLPWTITICTACPEKISIEDIISAKPSDLDVDACYLSGDYTEKKQTVSIGNMAELKGFEFSLVVVVGCGASMLPLPGRCRDEVWRDALRLYVAMTRARDSVYLLFSEEPSPFLQVMGQKVSWANFDPATVAEEK